MSWNLHKGADHAKFHITWNSLSKRNTGMAALGAVMSNHNVPYVSRDDDVTAWLLLVSVDYLLHERRTDRQTDRQRHRQTYHLPAGLLPWQRRPQQQQRCCDKDDRVITMDRRLEMTISHWGSCSHWHLHTHTHSTVQYSTVGVRQACTVSRDLTIHHVTGDHKHDKMRWHSLFHDFSYTLFSTQLHVCCSSQRNRASLHFI